jgi:hypothetical protein
LPLRAPELIYDKGDLLFHDSSMKVCLVIWTKFSPYDSMLIRRNKYEVIIKLITQMDANSRDESIKPN